MMADDFLTVTVRGVGPEGEVERSFALPTWLAEQTRFMTSGAENAIGRRLGGAIGEVLDAVEEAEKDGE
jgi:hypothetical protein